MLHDMSNASGCTMWEQLRAATDELLKTADRQLGYQRIVWVVITFYGSDGEPCVRPSLGGPMGDPFVERCFAQAFARGIA